MSKKRLWTWKLTKRDNGHGVMHPCTIVVEQTPDYFRRIVTTVVGSDHKRDSKLLAAAPSLYNALEKLVRQLGDSPITEEARAALARVSSKEPPT